MTRGKTVKIFCGKTDQKLGEAVLYPAGWRFYPAPSDKRRMPSNKFYETWECCLPRWVGRLFDAEVNDA